MASPYDALITSEAQQAHVDPGLVRSVMNTESGGNPRAVSPTGAQGLMQLMPDTAKSLGVKDAFDPAQNIHGGVAYLAQLLQRFKGNRDLAVAAYNAGPGAVEKYGGVPPYKETEQYVARVTGKPWRRQEARAVADPYGFGKSAERATAPDPYGFSKPSPTPTAKPADPYGFGKTPPANPMDTSGGTPTLPTGQSLPQMTHSVINQIGGHQDVVFILSNAQLRDGGQKSIKDLLADPHSHVAQAWALYKRDPAQAMDEYGAGSPAQNTYMAQHFPDSNEGKYGKFMGEHPKTNAAVTLIEEMFNPVAWAEGGIAGRVAGALGKTAGVQKAAQAVAKPFGLGSPLAEIQERAGTEGSQWVKGLIASTKHADSLSHAQMMDTFSGLTRDAQWEVVRLSQGLKPDPKFFQQSGDLIRRAQALRADIQHVTGEQQRVGLLQQAQTYNPQTYFPMAHSYDFGPQYELEQRLRGSAGTGGGGGTARRPKSFDTVDAARGSGLLKDDVSAAENYVTWRRQRMQNVAFEDAMARAPQSLRLPSTPASRAALNASGGKIGGKQYVATKDVVPMANQRIASPTMRRSLIAPELWKFYGENGAFKKFVDQSGSNLPGEEGSWGQRLVGVFRNMIVSNPVFHPAVNIAGNDAAARGMKNLGGPVFEAGGYGYNAAKAVALQAGLKKPEDFIGGAKEYASWMDRALKAGAIAEFGVSRTSTMGGSSARVVSESAAGKPWYQRLDKAMTRFNQWNAERTFGDKGERTFATSLFKDAVERGGMSDYDAARVVREALGDYYNFDPKSKWSAGLFFMPWLKSNTKFWVSALTQKPQYVTGPQHAIRNYNQQTNDPAMTSPFAPPDWRVNVGEDKQTGAPRYVTPPFVGRIVSDVAQTVGGVVEGKPEESTYAIDKTLEGRTNPAVRAGLDALYTTWKGGSGKDLIGPETDYHAIFNPKAPAREKWVQIGRYAVGHGVPIPLFSYALQDAMRRGWDPHDLTTALLTASGVGYGSQGMTDDQRRQISAAQKAYLRTYYAYQDNKDDHMLQDAWDTYTTTLRDVGVIK